MQQREIDEWLFFYEEPMCISFATHSGIHLAVGPALELKVNEIIEVDDQQYQVLFVNGDTATCRRIP